MFLNNLFSIITERIDGQCSEYRIRLNKDHPIYSGHFPGNPITPGVCVVQIVTDLFSHHLQQKCKLTTAKNIKFLKLIKPDEHAEISYKLEWEMQDDESYKIKAIVSDGDTLFSKISIVLHCVK